MGQKVNPVGFRVAVTHAWGSRWFAPKRNFAAFLIEDQKIRETIKKSLPEAGISKILIERYANRVRVTLFSARPGVIIGPGCVIEPHTPEKFLRLVHDTIVECGKKNCCCCK